MATNVFGPLDFGRYVATNKLTFGENIDQIVTSMVLHISFNRVRMGKDVTIPHVQGLFKYQR